MRRYAIWNKTDDIITPSGAVFTAEQWKEKYPVAKLDKITIVCSAGELNGSFFGTLGSMINRYKSEGVDFSACKTDEEKLALIELYDENKAAEMKAKAEEEAITKAMNEELTATSLASIAASLDYQNMLTLEDMEV